MQNIQIQKTQTHMQRGAFILLEGLDCSGKSTQAKRLVQHLTGAGIKSKFIRFPERATTIGKLIDSYLKTSSNLSPQVIHLLYSANRWELADSIKEDIESGTTLVCDRYAPSGVAYSTSLQVPDMDLDWCKSADRTLPAPDLVLFLKVSPEVQKLRAGYGEERYENAKMQKRVYSNYQQLFDDTWQEINADNELDRVFSDICTVVEKRIKNLDPKLGKLWVGEETSSPEKETFPSVSVSKS